LSISQRVLRSFVVACAVLPFATTLVAAQTSAVSTNYLAWIQLTESRNDIVRLDTSRIVDYEQYVGIWLLLQRKRALRDASGRDLRGSAFFEELDCSENRSRRWEIHALNERGETVATQAFTSASWALFRDHVLGEQPLLLACVRLAERKRGPA